MKNRKKRMIAYEVTLQAEIDADEEAKRIELEEYLASPEYQKQRSLGEGLAHASAKPKKKKKKSFFGKD